jgi:ATP-dependent Zn protease
VNSKRVCRCHEPEKPPEYETFEQFCRNRKRRRRVLAVVSLIAAASVSIACFVAWRAIRAAMRPEVVGRLGEDVQRQVARHEAAHGVVHVLTLRQSEVVAYLRVKTTVHEDGGLGSTLPEASAITALTPREARNDLAVYCAGRAADKILNGTISEASHSDMAKATALAERMHGRFSFGPFLSAREELRPEHLLLVELELQCACKRAEKIVADNRETIEAVADLLMSKPDLDGQRYLDGVEFYQFLTDRADALVPAPEPEFPCALP